MDTKIRLLSSLFVGTLFGLVVGMYAQSSSAARLAKLSEEKAEITKMDLVLLNTRIEVLQQILRDDLSLPFGPTTFKYDADKKKIRVGVYVDPAVLAKTNAIQLSKTLETRATSLCIAPTLADGNLPYLFPTLPADYCAVTFFTHAMDPSGHVQLKDVATFEDGKLTTK